MGTKKRKPRHQPRKPSHGSEELYRNAIVYGGVQQIIHRGHAIRPTNPARSAPKSSKS